MTSSDSRLLSVSARGRNSSLRGCSCLLGSSVRRITGRAEVLGAKVGKKGAGVVGSSVGIKLSDMVGRKTESLSILASSPPVEL